jgi:hypothetical protein
MWGSGEYQSCDRKLTVQKYKYSIRFTYNSVFSARWSSAKQSTNVTGVASIFTANASRDLSRHTRGTICEARKDICVSVEEKLREYLHCATPRLILDSREFLSHCIAAMKIGCKYKIVTFINIQFQTSFNCFMQYAL